MHFLHILLKSVHFLSQKSKTQKFLRKDTPQGLLYPCPLYRPLTTTHTQEKVKAFYLLEKQCQCSG